MEYYEWKNRPGFAVYPVAKISDDRVQVIMVGDDKVWTVNEEDLRELKDGEFCYDCGQIGCGH